MNKVTVDSYPSLLVKLICIFSIVSVTIISIVLYYFLKAKESLIILGFVPFQILGGIFLSRKMSKEKGLVFSNEGIFMNDEKIADYCDIKELKKDGFLRYTITFNNGKFCLLYLTEQKHLFLKENFNI